MFGYTLVKTSKIESPKSERAEIIDTILTLTPLLADGTAVRDEVKSLANEKIRDLIKLL